MHIYIHALCLPFVISHPPDLPICTATAAASGGTGAPRLGRAAECDASR